MLTKADVFIFTFGLTEAWVHSESGTVYPTAPGTVAGSFNPDVVSFKNFTYNEILTDFLEFRKLIHSVNPSVRFLITVSPVSLAATATGEHVLKATTHSKSVLRAVAGELAASHSDIDYFPSYDLITAGVTRAKFFDESLREVTPAGVSCVMDHFFSQHPRANARASDAAQTSPTNDQVLCEEALLKVFSQ